jgi:glycosyltransferase involved in cell wall biosynthesis
VRRRLFESIGGLSGEFWPGAGAHLDLAFGVRAQGFRTLVQPLARVSELPRPEGAADPGPDQRFAPADAAALRRRWADTLQTHGSNTGADALWQGSNRRPRGMVLVCDNDVPTPDRDSGSRRMDGIIRILSDLGYAVYLAPGTLRALEPYTGQIGQRGVTVLASEHAQFTFIREAGPRLRAVLLSRPAVAHRYLEHLYTHAPDAIRMFDTVDLHALRLWREFGVNRRPETLARARYTWAMERAAIELCDVTFVVSGVERSLLARELPQATVRVLSNIHLPVVDHPDPLGRNGMMFVGNFEHPPNADAIDWFAQEILPLIREQEPDATLTVVGSHLPESVAEWETAGVEIAGWVPDIAPMYRAARVVVAPLRYGAGVKGKVAEAVEHGVPVVGTPIALEGMGFELGLDVEAADDPRRFADAVIRLLRDDARWRAMAGRGQAVLTRVFAPWVARSVLVEVLTGDRARDESPFAGWPTSGGVNDPSTDRPSPGAVAG